VTFSSDALDKTITIPASSEIETMARLQSAGGSCLMEQCSDILVAKAVITPLRSDILMHNVNTTTMPIILYHGTNVASAELIGDISICGIG